MWLFHGARLQVGVVVALDESTGGCQCGCSMVRDYRWVLLLHLMKVQVGVNVVVPWCEITGGCCCCT